MSGPLPAALNNSPHLQRLSIAAVEDLRESVRGELSLAFGQFMDHLTRQMTQAADKALNPIEQQTFRELSVMLNKGNPRWVESFTEFVDVHFTGGTLPQRVLKPGQQAPMDDSMAFANVELRAEARYAKQVTELDARVNRLRLMLFVPVYTKALAPAGLCRSLQDTATAMNWPGRQRKLLLEHFDSAFITELEKVYRALIAAVTRIGEDTALTAANSTQQLIPQPVQPPQRQKKSATTMEMPTDEKHVDPETVSMLQTFALKGTGEGYTDSLLAADLLALADNQPLPGVAQDQSWVPIQRIALAGHFLNEMIADPMVPDELIPQHESMRYPLVKSALTDETLFTSPSHPLANMINEMLLKSATSRVTGNAETKRMADLLQQVLVQFDLAPEFVRQSMQNSQPIEKTQIERFVAFQRKQAQQRRDFVISEAKRVVASQLESLTFGRFTPPPAIKFLNTAWGPLLTKRLLQHGAAHPLCKAGTTLMEQLLDQLDERHPEEEAPPEWKELTMTMIKALIAEGLPQDYLKVAIANLDAARKTRRAM